MGVPVIKHGEIISLEQRQLISRRYQTITKVINREFWEISSSTDNSYYVGSYGRGTAIDDSDIDILVILPRTEYERFDDAKGNGQSRLLQSVKSAIDETYSGTDVKADGQVVVLKFSDGMKIEVLPSFEKSYSWGIEFDYPDTNMGGNWKSTNPFAEQKAMQDKNKSSNGLLFDTCKHIRRMHLDGFKSYHLSGIVVDSFVYEAMKQWQWTPPGQNPAPSEIKYEQVLLNYYNQITWNGVFDMQIQAPGSGKNVDSSDSYECLGKILRKMAE